MFVRWKLRRTQVGGRFCGSLVMNERIDGRVRQRSILYLGSVTTRQLERDPRAVDDFWWKVDRAIRKKMSDLKREPKAAEERLLSEARSKLRKAFFNAFPQQRELGFRLPQGLRARGTRGGAPSWREPAPS